MYGHAVGVPTLVVPGQRDEMILGTNVIKYIISQMKNVQGNCVDLKVRKMIQLYSFWTCCLASTDGRALKCPVR